MTVAIPDDTYRRARIRAAEQGTSVSALVAEYLQSLSDRDEESRFTTLRALQRRTSTEVQRFSAGHRLSRDEVHDRAGLR